VSNTIVEKVAAGIGNLPDSATFEEIARVAIEEYRRALWIPITGAPARDGKFFPELRRIRALLITNQIMSSLRRDMQIPIERDRHKACHDTLLALFMETGAEVITDIDRRNVGLPPRDEYGMTPPELSLFELRRLETMMGTVAPLTMGEQAIARELKPHA
jgi:hypothetical protein